MRKKQEFQSEFVGEFRVYCSSMHLVLRGRAFEWWTRREHISEVLFWLKNHEFWQGPYFVDELNEAIAGLIDDPLDWEFYRRMIKDAKQDPFEFEIRVLRRFKFENYADDLHYDDDREKWNNLTMAAKKCLWGDLAEAFGKERKVMYLRLYTWSNERELAKLQEDEAELVEYGEPEDEDPITGEDVDPIGLPLGPAWWYNS